MQRGYAGAETAAVQQRIQSLETEIAKLRAENHADNRIQRQKNSIRGTGTSRSRLHGATSTTSVRREKVAPQRVELEVGRLIRGHGPGQRKGNKGAGTRKMRKGKGKHNKTTGTRWRGGATTTKSPLMHNRTRPHGQKWRLGSLSLSRDTDIHSNADSDPDSDADLDDLLSLDPALSSKVRQAFPSPTTSPTASDSTTTPATTSTSNTDDNEVQSLLSSLELRSRQSTRKLDAQAARMDLDKALLNSLSKNLHHTGTAAHHKRRKSKGAGKHTLPEVQISPTSQTHATESTATSKSTSTSKARIAPTPVPLKGVDGLYSRLEARAATQSRYSFSKLQ